MEFVTESNVSLPESARLEWQGWNVDGIAVSDVASFFEGYVETLLWTASWDSETGDAPDGYDNQSITLTPEELSELTSDALAFVASCRRELLDAANHARNAMLDDDDKWRNLGHDFALSRNGHGAGFWDRGYGVTGTALHDHAAAFGECNVSAWVAENDEIRVDIY